MGPRQHAFASDKTYKSSTFHCNCTSNSQDKIVPHGKAKKYIEEQGTHRKSCLE